jgi:hypothetical protein
VLTLGWSNGYHLCISIFFTKFKNAQINSISAAIDKLTLRYKLRIEASESSSLIIPSIIDRTFKAGESADCVDGYLIYATASPSILVEIGKMWLEWSKQPTLFCRETIDFPWKNYINHYTSSMRERDFPFNSYNDGQRFQVKIVFIQNRNKKSNGLRFSRPILRFQTGNSKDLWHWVLLYLYDD